MQEYTHHNIHDMDAFAGLNTEKRAIRLANGDRPGEIVHGFYALVNDSGEPLPTRPVPRSYKLVPHLAMFRSQAHQLQESNLPTQNVTITDRVYDGGLRATREIHFDDLRLDMPVGDGRLQDDQTARMDTINSIDQSWAFQAFAGAYRAYCRNQQVFGGQKLYHARRKHTRNLSPESITANSIIGLDTFANNRDYFRRMTDVRMSPEQFGQIISRTLAFKKGRASDIILADDELTLADKRKATINQGLLGQMVHRFENESTDLGSTAWAAYNALTAWATHVEDDALWFDNEKGMYRTQKARTTDPNRVPHVRMQRQQKVRDVLDSHHWQNHMLAAA